MKSAVKEVPMLYFRENEFSVNMKTLLIGLYFGKILGDLRKKERKKITEQEK